MSEYNISVHSAITCPDCGHRKVEIMPTDACLFFMNVKSAKHCLNHCKATVVCFAVMEARSVLLFKQKINVTNKILFLICSTKS